MSRTVWTGGLVFLALGAVAAVAAVGPTVVYSNIASSPTSDVPGLTGVKFRPGTASQFDRPYRSLSGQYWAFTALTTLPDVENEVLLVGSGTTGTVVVREGTQAPWAATGELVGLLRRNLGINDSGHLAFGTNLGGTAPTAKDEHVVFWDGATFTLAATEGGAVPGVPGELFGTTLDSIGLTNAGAVAFRAPLTVGNLPTTQDDFLFRGTTAVAQSGVSIPTGQAGGATNPWENFAAEDFYTDAAGVNWLAAGDLTGATTSDNIVAYNNHVVIQEGVALPGMGAAVSSITESLMTPNGDWWARGSNAGGQDWVVRNGVLLAKTGDPVPGGLPGETMADALYAPTFFIMASNANGDFVYGATTSNPDPEFDAVLILNNTSVLLRQGDPVDVDGNGLFDDNAYIDVFNNEDSFLTDDGWYYFMADLRNAASDSIGQAFLRVAIPEPATLGLLLAGLLGLRRR